MKNTILVTTLLLMQLCFFTKAESKACKKKIVTIKGMITTSRSYCGGARPSDEMLEKLKIPVPAANKTIYIKIGTQNSEKLPLYKKVITNAKGEFEVNVEKGNSYIFIEEWKSLPFKMPANTEYIVWDQVCYKKSYETPDYLLETKKNTSKSITINYHQPCFYNPYCGKYSGPLPP